MAQCLRCWRGSHSASVQPQRHYSIRPTFRFLTSYRTVYPLWYQPSSRPIQAPLMPGSQSTRPSQTMKLSVLSALNPAAQGGRCRSSGRGMTRSLPSPLAAFCAISQAMRAYSVKSPNVSTITTSRTRRRCPRTTSRSTPLHQLECKRRGRRRLHRTSSSPTKNRSPRPDP